VKAVGIGGHAVIGPVQGRQFNPQPEISVHSASSWIQHCLLLSQHSTMAAAGRTLLQNTAATSSLAQTLFYEGLPLFALFALPCIMLILLA